MSFRDYICCSACGSKVVYDGDDNGREGLESRYSTREVTCPDCVSKLRSDVDALRADAERYRWLRNAAGRGAAGSIFDNFNGSAVDECIDAARAAQGGQHG